MNLFNKTASKNFICAISFLACFFTACSDANPFDKTEDDIADTRYKIDRDYNSKESNSTTNSSKSQSDSNSTTNTYYNNTSKSSKKNYLTTSKTLHFTLTHYKQSICSMEGKGSSSCNYDDADPRVSFKIKFIQTNGDSTTYSTIDKLGKNWFYFDNKGKWDGTKTFTVNVPAYTDTIQVCPTVVDVDLLFEDYMSSGYCYYIYDVGFLDYAEVVYQSDYESKNCELKWEWYLD